MTGPGEWVMVRRYVPVPIEPAVEARDGHRVGTGEGRRRRRSQRRRCRIDCENGAARILQPDPRTEVVVIDDFTDVHRDPVAGGRGEGPYRFRRPVDGARLKPSIHQSAAAPAPVACTTTVSGGLLLRPSLTISRIV